MYMQLGECHAYVRDVSICCRPLDEDENVERTRIETRIEDFPLR